MGVDSLPDGLRLSLLARVEASHDPLELGELADHAGRQIAFRELRRPTHGRFPGSALRRDPGGEGLDPLALEPVASQLFLEEDTVEGRRPIPKRGLQVLAPEELRVAEAGDHDPLGSPLDMGLRVLRHVGRGDEARLAHERKVVLVVDEDRVANLLGEARELFGVGAEDRAGPLHEIGHEVAREAGRAFGSRLLLELRDLAREHLAPLFGIEHHEALLETAGELLERIDSERLPRLLPFGSEKPMSPRLSPAPYRGRARDSNLERHDVVSEERHHPADGSPEGESPLPVLERRVPVHEPGEAQAPQRRGHDAGKKLQSLSAFDLPFESDVLAFLRREEFQVRGLDAVLGRESEGGLGPGARVVAGDFQRRAGNLFDPVLLLLGKPGRVEHQPPERPVGFHPLRLERERRELFLEALLQLGHQLREPRRGDLLAPDLPEEGEPLHAEASFVDRDST